MVILYDVGENLETEENGIFFFYSSLLDKETNPNLDSTIKGLVKKLWAKKIHEEINAPKEREIGERGGQTQLIPCVVKLSQSCMGTLNQVLFVLQYCGITFI